MAGYTPDQYKHGGGRPHSHAIYGDAPLDFLPQPLAGKRILDVGCGNGYWAGQMKARGAEVVGIDGSTMGLEYARREHPGIRFEQMLATDTLLKDLGVPPFDGVIAVEVIEHIFDPRGFVDACSKALKPGGTLVLTTPFHGYWKNLALALAGKWDFHHTALMDGGHVKFWSRQTLSALLTEMGYRNITFRGYGRLPHLWMGMVLSGVKG